MFEKSALREETKKVRGMLDKALYPETYAALSDVFINEDTPFIIASNLMECDKPKDLPPFVIEYITALYEIEICANSNLPNTFVPGLVLPLRTTKAPTRRRQLASAKQGNT